jgi:hypothetical protein
VEADPVMRLGLDRVLCGKEFDDEFGYLAPLQTKLLARRPMTRGRQKDTTLPPSRALVIQRAYRDRKAKHLADLEERCQKAEEENERLRKELEIARAESPVVSINLELVIRCHIHIFGKSGEK